MAGRLDLDHSTYVRYERPERFKKRHLPVALTRKIAAVLADHGINPDHVLELAGIGGDDEPMPALSAGEEQLLDEYRTLTPEQRRLLLQLAKEMTGAPATSRVHAERKPYDAEGAPQ